ncbi:DNA repair exonuclease [Luteolibacter pohnpeiensis]|uniref:DNA repair exonuclease n=1 Tax=Luteolibacter pohnpeiensis TaxID=454153 RepID=A0A934VVF8_9BACT|nr:DNA repair exonuclease [Luteolibacter pohnpeiensis]MBK1881753.1 DNA repair exonuclease [Luteolibacter pohnpeiensis]
MVTARFLHTADWQLGRPFASVGDESKRHRLQQERLRVIERIGKIAKESAVDFILVAGDLFDSPHVTKATVSAACGAIGEINIPVIIIPGNHDHGGPGSIWQQDFFLREQQQLAPNLRIILNPEPVVLEKAVIFPAPLLRRHETTNPVSWIRESLLTRSFPPDLPRIVLAHGTIQGFSAENDDEQSGPSVANWIDLTSLPLDEMDYLALGDWHGTKQVGAKAWYSGTPEMDRFPKGDGNDPGNLLKVAISRGQSPQVEKIPVSGFIWKEFTFHFSEDSSLDRFAEQIDAFIGSSSNTQLLKLRLQGALGIAASARLEQILESWESRLVRLKLDFQVTIAPTQEEITHLTCNPSDPLISTVASQLVIRAEGNSDEAAIARIALRELHAALLDT